MHGPVLLIVGTRPEAIKMAPVYFAFKKRGIPTALCSTTQHTNLLSEALELFDIRPDKELHVMKEGQDLFHITTNVLEKIKGYLQELKPSLVLVQGDTTTTMASALAAYYLKIPVGHIEAGLRTGDLFDPFPEETNRKLLATLAQFHFCPTQRAQKNLISEGISKENSPITGNTVVDALRIVNKYIIAKKLIPSDATLQFFKQAQEHQKKVIVLTTHRRESFGENMHCILSTIKAYAHTNENVLFYYPVHPNPEVKKAIRATRLSEQKNITICSPISYIDMVYALTYAHGVATDSGGICEEATSLGKQTLILRKKTERPESIESGLARLVGTDQQAIVAGLEHICNHKPLDNPSQVYGDGYAAEKIVQYLTNHMPQLFQKEPMWQSNKKQKAL